MKIGDKVDYHVGVGEKSQNSKLVLEEFEVYKVLEHTVWLRNENSSHVVAFKNQVITHSMSNYKQRYKAMKNAMGWTNQDIADITGNSLNSIEVVTTKPDDSFPRWAKLSIVLFEEMISRGKITYPKPEPPQSEDGKE